MKVLLAIVLGFALLLLVGGAYLFYRLRRLAESVEVHELVDSLDDGLAIPMRDCNTHPASRKHP